MSIDDFFANLWADYIASTPQAEKIKQAFEAKGERVVNDHVAFRTLALEPIRLKALEPHLLAVGYTPYEPYDFAAKKLSAYGYLPPGPELPRVFLSELRVDELSDASAKILRGLAEQVDAEKVKDPSILWSGRLWDPVSWDDYQTLLAESEYAAWMATIGIRPNHFTISVNYLEQHPEVEDVLRTVEGLGYQVNDSGGRVKGSPEVLLEQGSTMADRMKVPFADGQEREVPTCYYEFAKRYKTPSGELYPGFVAQSADKIFESTNVGKSGS
ncbi:hypothetical protein KOR34_21940 [Posidoniimonas corsicana]|uniref:2-oxoadipate dioxygenase/decarboxylase n=1 Tax=Posidoniimonas corsicana TaxID=1938618 RepID=A0A5C5VH03_9BACT|nr:DUF1338 domain-containing protein [Posidoniimonas corsicana]TWT37247.1 hypothetical protein KOR34_21940 [Posidoniimonas corsicana]